MSVDAVTVTAEMLGLCNLTIHHNASDFEGKSIREKPSENRCARFLAVPSCQMPFLNSQEASTSLPLWRENAYFSLQSGKREMHGDMEMEECRESGGGGWNGNMAKGQWNSINLSECIWSWAFDRNREGRMRPREGKQGGGGSVTPWCDSLWTFCDFVHVQKNCLFVMPKVQRWQGYSAVIFPARRGDTCSGCGPCRFS